MGNLTFKPLLDAPNYQLNFVCADHGLIAQRNSSIQTENFSMHAMQQFPHKSAVIIGRWVNGCKVFWTTIDAVHWSKGFKKVRVRSQGQVGNCALGNVRVPNLLRHCKRHQHDLGAWQKHVNSTWTANEELTSRHRATSDITYENFGYMLQSYHFTYWKKMGYLQRQQNSGSQVPHMDGELIDYSGRSPIWRQIIRYMQLSAHRSKQQCLRPQTKLVALVCPHAWYVINIKIR